MKKIIFINVPAQEVKTTNYKVAENSKLEYSGKVMCAMDSILAKTLKKEDNVKIVYVKEIQKRETKFEENMQKELEDINKNIGANIEFKTICKPFEETQESHIKLFEDLIDELEENAEVSVDITYGRKTLPFIIFNILNFAAKCCKADINNIIYSKVNYKKDSNGQPICDEKGRPEVEDGTIFDLSPIYYLNSVSSTIKCDNMKEAKQIIKKIINM